MFGTPFGAYVDRDDPPSCTYLIHAINSAPCGLAVSGGGPNPPLRSATSPKIGNPSPPLEKPKQR